MKPTLLFDPHPRRTDIIFTAADLARLQSAGTILWDSDDPVPEDELSRVEADVEIIVTGSWRHGDVARFPRLRAIMEVGGGFPSPKILDYAQCFARGIRVMSCAPAFGPAVAEMALGCPIQVHDPWLTDTFLRTRGVTPVDIDTLLGTSRFIYVLAVPSAENRAFLNRPALELIQPDAVLLLMSRAHVVDFDALTELVLAGRFRAGIDVYPEEPLPADHPIRTAEHAVLSSHRAGANAEALHAVGRIVADDVEAIAQGAIPFAMQQAQPEFIRAAYRQRPPRPEPRNQIP